MAKKKKFLIRGNIACEFTVAIEAKNPEEATEILEEWTLADFESKSLQADYVVEQETVEAAVEH